MPIYEYSAINSQGKTSKGSVDAENIRAARQKLRGQSIFPTDIKEGIAAAQQKSRDVKKYFVSNRVSTRELAFATRQLATLVGAGLPLVSALQALGEQTDSEVLKRIVVDIKENVEEGTSLAKSLGNFPKSFPRLYINMVAAGEASGTLDAVLTDLASYLESQLELRRKVNSALMYPILMLVLCTGVIIALFVFVIPKIVDIFKKQGAILPLPTRVMLFISDFLVYYWYIPALVITIIFFLSRWYWHQPEGRSNIDRILLKLPIFGKIYLKISTARVARTLGTLLSSGVGLLAGLDITKNIVANVHIVKALEDAQDGVREGRSLAGEFNRSQIFPVMLSHMVAVGEKSGELEQMLDRAAHAYERDVDATLSGLTSLLEPVMLVVVGMIVLTIVISVLMPMTDLINVVQN